MSRASTAIKRLKGRIRRVYEAAQPEINALAVDSASYLKVHDSEDERLFLHPLMQRLMEAAFTLGAANDYLATAYRRKDQENEFLYRVLDAIIKANGGALAVPQDAFASMEEAPQRIKGHLLKGSDDPRFEALVGSILLTRTEEALLSAERPGWLENCLRGIYREKDFRWLGDNAAEKLREPEAQYLPVFGVKEIYAEIAPQGARETTS